MTLLQERFRLTRDFARDLTADITTSGALNNVSVTAISAVRFTLATSISGFAGNGLSQIVSVINANTVALQILNENANSTAANRISTGTGSDVTIPAGGLFEIFYDTVATRWRLLSGGGGTQLNEQPLKNYLLTYANAGIAPGTLALIAATGNIATTAGLFHADTTSGAAALTSSASTALRGAFNYLTAVSGAALAGTTFVQFPAFALEAPDLGKAIPINFDINSTLTDGDWDIVVVRYNSSGTYQETLAVAGNASGATQPSAKLPGGTSQFNGFFVSGSTAGDLYALRLRRLVGSVQVRTDTLFAGPQPVRLGAAITDWQVYTPSLLNLGTGSGTAVGFFRRVGDTLECLIRFTKDASGGTGGAGVRFGLPSGLFIDLTKVQASGTIRNLQGFALSSTGTSYLSGFNVATTDSVRFLTTSGGEAAGSVFVANSVWDMFFSVPIAGWSSNIVTGDRAVFEYSANSSTTDANDTTSFVNGINGSVVPGALTGTRLKRVRFLSPIQATDAFSIEVQISGTGPWVPLVSYNNAVGIQPLTNQNGVTYGIGWRSVSGSSTDIDVEFGQYSYASGTYGVAGVSWATISTTRYRVNKGSGGQVVGFPIGARNVLGDTSGTVVPTGFIGERIAANNGSNTAFPATTVTGDATSITLTAGIWDITAQLLIDNGAYTATQISFGISTTAGNSGVGLVSGDNNMNIAPPATPSTSATSGTISGYRVNPSVSTIYYFKVQAIYTVGAPNYRYRISAVRVG